MKYVVIATLLAFSFVSCGEDDKKEVEKQETQKPAAPSSDMEKISYSIGSQQATPMLSSQNPNKDKFDKRALLEGFKNGFGPIEESKRQECMMSLQNMMGGGQGMPFNESYAKEGCTSIGILTASDIYANFESFGMLDRLDKAMLIRGFEDGLNGVANPVPQEEQQQLFQKFNTEIMAVKEEQYKPRWEEIKAIPGIKELDKGIYMETIKAGTGAKPKFGEDIEASYILKRFDGTIKETSENAPGGRFQANLHLGAGGLIEGWVIGFQEMRVGGKYRLYVPSEMAYGEEPLDFEIEFFKKGPEGSLVKPRPQTPMPQ